jgi:phenylalanyl-tRNA synthetase beta chain
MSGPRVEHSWLGGDGNFDFYDVKGLIEILMERQGWAISFDKSDDTGLHPSRQAAIVVKENGVKTILGVIGELHPVVAGRFELEDTVCMFEIDLTTLAAFGRSSVMYQAVPRFPSMIRDIALVVDTEVAHGRIIEIIKSYPLITEVKLFDVYSGKQVDAGKKSLAYRLVFQSAESTLTDDQVNRVQKKLLSRLEQELGATLRG